MIEMVKSPSTRVLSKGCLAAWLAVALVFAALLVAPDAQAHGTNAPKRAAETSIGEGTAGGGAPTEQAPSPAEEDTPPAEEPTPPTEEPTSPAAQGQPPAEEAIPPAEEVTPPAEQAQPPAEQTPPPAEEPIPPAEQAQPPAEEPAPPTEEPTPPAEQAQPPAEEATPPAEQAQTAAEPTPPPAEEPTPPQTLPTTKEVPPAVEDGNVKEVVAEAGSDGAASEDTGGNSQVSAVASRPSAEDTAGEVAAGGSTSLTTSAAPGVLPESLTSPAQSQSSLALGPREISVRRAGQATCELAGIGGGITVGRAGDWLEISTASSDLPSPFAIAGASRTATTSGAPDGSQDGGSAVENHPSAPFPGPGPGGAGGAAAAGGSPGSALSPSFTLAGVLLQAEPRAMRRLRLSQQSWRTSFFVLIPERPD